MQQHKELARQILQLLREQRGEQGLRRVAIRKALGLTGRSDLAPFREVFRELLTHGLILRQRGGRYAASTERGLVAGTLRLSQRGFGFVAPDAGGDSIFIPPQALGGAISGDRVLASILSRDDERGPVGEVREVVERRHRILVASLVDLRGGPAVRPLRRELPETIALAERGHGVDIEDLVPGDWLQVRLNPQDGPRDALQAVILRRLAAANPISADLDAVALEFSLPPPHTAEEEREAAAAQPMLLPREDATGLPVITIDPVDAKDFDDALSCGPGSRPGCVSVGVHIADVAAYVPVGSALDAGAMVRGFTAYLPGRTLPMLPRPLASGTCSLVEGEERPAHSVYLEVNEESGEILSARRCRTLIRVSRRLTFEAVGAILDGDPVASAESGRDVVALVRRLGALAETMRGRRAAAEGFLRLAVPEVRVLCSEDPPRIMALQRVEPKAAHALVEEFMLAANVAVAEELRARDLPGVFRNHEAPKPADLAALAVWIGQTLGSGRVNLADRDALNRFLDGLETSPLRDVAMSQFLRALPRAGYGGACTGHYGLGKAVYCHFTSPIRRYPDLAVHQQLLAWDLGQPLRSAETCGEIAAACTRLEEQVDAAYYAAVDRLKLRYIRERQEISPGEVYEARVARCLAQGLLVYVPDLGMQGFVPVNRLPPGTYRADARSGRLHGAGSGKSYKNGDSIHVQVRRADTVRGELHLDPVRARV